MYGAKPARGGKHDVRIGLYRTKNPISGETHEGERS
jgi:hypothetical protein